MSFFIANWKTKNSANLSSKCANYLIETQLNLRPIHLITGSYTDLMSPPITSDCHQRHNWWWRIAW